MADLGSRMTLEVQAAVIRSLSVGDYVRTNYISSQEIFLNDGYVVGQVLTVYNLHSASPSATMQVVNRENNDVRIGAVWAINPTNPNAIIWRVSREVAAGAVEAAVKHRVPAGSEWLA